MKYLLDVNVLISLCDSNHVFHEKAWKWFDRKAKNGWATCPITQNALVRIMSHSSYPGNPGGVEVVSAILHSLLKVKGHQFIPDNISINSSLFYLNIVSVSSKQITDVYLLALSVYHKVKFATFDSKIPYDSVDRGKEHLELIAA
ncbi:TA system VapC family ribonuclease toxin [Leptospira interrogans]|uniref:TA system VapC family ribonuclease toxin n=1 Tax=Leptospira interrogans TaxID=173 RepID=UPI0002927DCB|nr:TA system VapC family ribonuclease toxin [Leptospira interrogans]EKO88382.1 PIN domain protein [Leptospira interrogans serovar Grippotyphosa str. Andaman]EKP83842.1 PIN domain protein [Leptospira interrogans serovar Grippotyphosa str. 2006006986]EKR81301.1 PIN domain protein [Leptospira interrogans str. UI 08452]EMN37331.1 PIN domain protein [Leptospira interrogans serovar Medanensis str. L0448]EMN39362.1 PIN domain protein [Leptospira interrogans str. L0996]